MARSSVSLCWVLCVLVCLVGAELVTEDMCSPASGTQVTVNTQRSDKGNWVAKVALDRGGGRGQMWTRPWTVAVDSNTKTCEGAESRFHVTLTLTAPLPKVGSDYELIPGVGYYKFHTGVNTWAGARKTCVEEGAHLAIINSETEAEVMKKLFAKHPQIPGASDNNYAWIGVQRKVNEYFTIFDDALATTGFTRWSPGEPHKTSTEDCILVARLTGGLADVGCSWKVAFICEHEL